MWGSPGGGARRFSPPKARDSSGLLANDPLMDQLGAAMEDLAASERELADALEPDAVLLVGGEPVQVSKLLASLHSPGARSHACLLRGAALLAATLNLDCRTACRSPASPSRPTHPTHSTLPSHRPAVLAKLLKGEPAEVLEPEAGEGLAGLPAFRLSFPEHEAFSPEVLQRSAYWAPGAKDFPALTPASVAALIFFGLTGRMPAPPAKVGGCLGGWVGAAACAGRPGAG